MEEIIDNKTKLINVKCDFCNSSDNVLLLKSKDFMFNNTSIEFIIKKCSKCGLIFTTPRLKSESLKYHYSKILNYDNRPLPYDLNHRFSVLRRLDILTYYYNYNFLRKSIIKKIIQYPNYLRIRRQWNHTPYVPKYKKNGNILEIGCSFGGFLYLFKKLGWKVKGIELNEEAVNYAKTKLNLDVENVNIENFETDQLFDLIYLINVLEHLESPKLVLLKISELLKPNGILIISVPDYSGLEVRLFKKYAYNLQVPFHLYHFTPRSLENYVKSVGLEKLKLIHLKTDREILGPLHFFLKENPKNLIVKFFFRLTLNKFIRYILNNFMLKISAYIGKTSRMTMITKKRFEI